MYMCTHVHAHAHAHVHAHVNMSCAGMCVRALTTSLDLYVGAFACEGAFGCGVLAVQLRLSCALDRLFRRVDLSVVQSSRE